MEQPKGEANENTYGRLKSCTTLPGVSHFPGQPRPCEAGKWRLPRTPSPLRPPRRPPRLPSPFTPFPTPDEPTNG